MAFSFITARRPGLVASALIFTLFEGLKGVRQMLGVFEAIEVFIYCSIIQILAYIQQWKNIRNSHLRKTRARIPFDSA